MELQEIQEQDDVLSDEDYPISDEEFDDTKKSSFASSIAKILKNDADTKTKVLSKSKKVDERKKKSIGFEVVGEDVKQEDVKDNKPTEEDLKFALQRKNYLERKKVS